MTTATLSSSSSSSDSWDLPAASSPRRAPYSAAAHVRDDWENDDDEDEDVQHTSGNTDDDPDFPPRNPPQSQTQDANKRLWEDANTHTPAPMPAVILSSSSASSSLSPPAGAFQPTMRILKRPTGPNANSKASNTPPSNSSETLKERERRYQEARERIFGAGGTGAEGREAELDEQLRTNIGANGSSASLGAAGSKATGRKGVSPQPQAAAVKVVREPKGPSEGASQPKGFGERRAKPPSAGGRTRNPEAS